ncbi:MAG TPA: hypothetical protein VM103_02370 [Candidatus Paceibacterota bacterium]|nr:hypothetical protein [Candidatus Paceibacterota bacterium]
MEMAKRFFWWDCVVGFVFTIALLAAWGTTQASSLPRVLYLGQEVLLGGEMYCADKKTAILIAITHGHGEQKRAHEIFMGNDTCDRVSPLVVRVGNQIYKGPLSVIEIIGSDGNILFYLVSDANWNPSLGT